MFVLFSTSDGPAALPIHRISAIVARPAGCDIYHGHGGEGGVAHCTESVETVSERINEVIKEYRQWS